MFKRLPPIFLVVLLCSFAACDLTDPEVDERQQALAAGFGRIAANDAGWSELNGQPGAIVRVFWSGPGCDAACTFEYDYGQGWQVLRAGTNFNFVNERMIELYGLTPGGSYKFRVTTPATPGRTINQGGGIATHVPGYPGQTSPVAEYIVAQQPPRVTVTVRNQGLPGAGGGVPSPFFNDWDRNTGTYIPNRITKADVVYAFIDDNSDTEVPLTPFTHTSIKDANGKLVDYRSLNVFGPSFNYVFKYSSAPSLPAVFDWRHLHSNYLAVDNGSNVSNFIAFARIHSWTTEVRPQYVAIHVQMNRTTGAFIRAVAMVAGDTQQNGNVQRVVMTSAIGEPPQKLRWDYMHGNGKDHDRVVAAFRGFVSFTHPQTGTPYQADITFDFESDIQRY